MVYYKGYEKKGFRSRFSEALGEGRLLKSIENFVQLDVFVPYIKYYAIKLNYSIVHRYFILSGKKYRYCLKRHMSVDNERAIEIPYSRSFISKNNARNLLEVGNVLSNYFDVCHDIVDKYETREGIINKDITNYSTWKRYALIIAISTVEHVGYDEPKKVKGKAAKAIRNMIRLLSEDGKLIITVPLNYNPEIDELLVNESIRFSEKHFMKRCSWLNSWKETSQAEALKCKYGSRYGAANAMALLVYRK